jgi:hypothetical protein
MPFVVKFQAGSDIRRASTEKPYSWQEASDLVKNLFELKGSFVLKYKDEEGTKKRRYRTPCGKFRARNMRRIFSAPFSLLAVSHMWDTASKEKGAEDQRSIKWRLFDHIDWTGYT